MSKALELARHLETLHINNMYKNDFYWTWDKTDEELELFPPDSQKRCAICGQVFLPASNRAKYCPACKQTVVRQQKAVSARRARAVER